MTRTCFLFILLLCCPCFAEKPTLYIVHASWCPPCVTFDRTFEKNEDFGNALRRAADLMHLDWQNPAQRTYAERTLKVDRVPSYVLVRNGRIVARHVGFTCVPADIEEAIRDLMQSLNIEWPPARNEVKPRPDPPQVPIVKAPGPLVDREARDAITKLATQSKDLTDDVRELRNQVTESNKVLRSQIESGSAAVRDLQTQVSQSNTDSKTHVETISRTLQKSIESTRLSTREEIQAILRERIAIDEARPQTDPKTASAAAPISTEIPSEPVAGPTASKWLRVLAWAGRTGLAIVAPEVAIPGSLGLTAAGLALRYLMKRRQPKPLGTVENPIRVTDPNEVRTETKYVVSETDVGEEAYKEAMRRVGNAHRETAPHIIDVLKQVDAAAKQLVHGKRIARRPSTAPVSENEP